MPIFGIKHLCSLRPISYLLFTPAFPNQLLVHYQRPSAEPRIANTYRAPIPTPAFVLAEEEDGRRRVAMMGIVGV
jgi:hypothetical protein